MTDTQLEADVTIADPLPDEPDAPAQIEDEPADPGPLPDEPASEPAPPTAPEITANVVQGVDGIWGVRVFTRHPDTLDVSVNGRGVWRGIA